MKILQVIVYTCTLLCTQWSYAEKVIITEQVNREIDISDLQDKRAYHLSKIAEIDALIGVAEVQIGKKFTNIDVIEAVGEVDSIVNEVNWTDIQPIKQEVNWSGDAITE